MSGLAPVSLTDDSHKTYAPIEPLFTMEVAAELIPFPSVSALYNWLHNHRETFRPRYQRSRGPSGRGFVKQFRMITHTEILLIRKMRLVEGRENSEYANNGRPKGRKRGPISSIIARAMQH